MARYLLDKDHFNQQQLLVKRRAFMPNPKDGKTSVYRIQGLTDADLWALGEERVARPSGRLLYGAAEVLVGQIEALGLRIEPDNKPPRHANIAAWPADKSAVIQRAQEAAAAARLRLR